jgi:hypothetical protein
MGNAETFRQGVGPAEYREHAPDQPLHALRVPLRPILMQGDSAREEPGVGDEILQVATSP